MIKPAISEIIAHRKHHKAPAPHASIANTAQAPAAKPNSVKDTSRTVYHIRTAPHRNAGFKNCKNSVAHSVPT